ncbi:centromere protein U isoform X2 [Dendrobates tinctorius]|uniref:centromere protein U isoform X2 n=1 Tax=Dendrobates tinctorius TaxID=92724 RepID=UPI003CC9818F
MSPSKKLKNINQSTKSLKSQNVKSPGRIKQEDAERSPLEIRKIMNKKVASPLLKEILAFANISAILKEPGDSFKEVAEEDSFNPPLHSTAVDDDDVDNILQTNENPAQIAAKLMFPIASVVQEKSMRPKNSKQNTAASMEPSAQKPDTAKPKDSLQKKTQKIPEPGPSKSHGTAKTQAIVEPSSTQGPNTTQKTNVRLQKKTQQIPEPGPSKTLETARTRSIGEPSSSQGPNAAPNSNVSLQKKTQKIPELGPSKIRGTARPQAIGEPSSTQGPSTTPIRKNLQKEAQNIPEPGPSKTCVTSRTLSVREPSSSQGPYTAQKTNVVSAKNTKAQRKVVTKSSKKKSIKDNTNIASGDPSSPEVVSKSVKNLSGLDIVLFECGKYIELHREEVETDVCKREVDAFYDSFKEQLSTTISQLQELKDLKRKNAKMLSEIGMKRKRLLEVKHAVLVKQPKLNVLQKEYSDLEKKRKSLKSARSILDNLTHFQDDYMKFKAENPHVQETYGTSSLPALCLEAGNIMKAEQHFHIVNRKLQSVIDKEKED